MRKKEREFALRVQAKLFLVGLALGLSLASAVTYAIVEPPPLSGPPVPMRDHVEEPSEEKIACGRILEELQSFRELHSENGLATGDFILDLSTEMGKWLKVFNRELAGKTVMFSPNYFEPISDTNQVTGEISEMVYDNTAQLDIMLEKIIASVEVCM